MSPKMIFLFLKIDYVQNIGPKKKIENSTRGTRVTNVGKILPM